MSYQAMREHGETLTAYYQVNEGNFESFNTV